MTLAVYTVKESPGGTDQEQRNSSRTSKEYAILAEGDPCASDAKVALKRWVENNEYRDQHGNTPESYDVREDEAGSGDGRHFVYRGTVIWSSLARDETLEESFDCTGGLAHITQSYKTNVYPVGKFKPVNYRGGIGWDGNQFAGCDIFEPSLTT